MKRELVDITMLIVGMSIEMAIDNSEPRSNIAKGFPHSNSKYQKSNQLLAESTRQPSYFAKAYACVAAQRGATFATINHYPARITISRYLTTPAYACACPKVGTLQSATKVYMKASKSSLFLL